MWVLYIFQILTPYHIYDLQIFSLSPQDDFSFCWLAFLVCESFLVWCSPSCLFLLFLLVLLQSYPKYHCKTNMRETFPCGFSISPWLEGLNKIPICLVTQSCLTLCSPVDCSPPGSSVCEILQARILGWVAISSSRGSSRPRDQTLISWIAGRFFAPWAIVDKSQNIRKWMFSLFSQYTVPIHFSILLL